MLTYEDALRIALAHLRPDCGLVESMTRELPFGWYFLAQVWRVPQRYPESQLEQFLQQLPHTLEGHGFYFALEVFEEMDQARCCTYELREHAPEQVRFPQS